MKILTAEIVRGRWNGRCMVKMEEGGRVVRRFIAANWIHAFNVAITWTGAYGRIRESEWGG